LGGRGFFEARFLGVTLGWSVLACPASRVCLFQRGSVSYVGSGAVAGASRRWTRRFAFVTVAVIRAWMATFHRPR